MLKLLALLIGVAQAMPADVTRLVNEEADRVGMERAYALAIVEIESSGNCSAVTGSYKGLLQLSDTEFKRMGGSNIFDCQENARIGLAKILKEADTFRSLNDRDPTAVELYLIHQQGPEGMAAHYNHLDLPAWKSLWLYTSEGIAKGEGWSRLAVWGNVPSDVKPRFKDVYNVTSRQFIEVWQEKLTRRLSQFAPVTPSPPKVTYTCHALPGGLRALRGLYADR